MQLPENVKNLEITVSKLVAKAWMDDKFRQRFISEPTAILREAGVVLGDFVKVIVTQESANSPLLKTADGGAVVYQINLPEKPDYLNEEKISDWGKALKQIPLCC